MYVKKIYINFAILPYQILEIVSLLQNVDFPTIYFLFRWYVNDMSRQRSESLLKQEDKEGCFVVRNSATIGLYTLSLYTKT